MILLLLVYNQSFLFLLMRFLLVIILQFFRTESIR